MAAFTWGAGERAYAAPDPAVLDGVVSARDGEQVATVPVQLELDACDCGAADPGAVSYDCDCPCHLPGGTA
jgi:hypothetical protein